MSHLDANLDLLSSRQPGLADALRCIQTSNVALFESASGNPTARYERKGSSFALHSRYDPVREARQIVAKQDASGADYLILLGFGLGYLLDALLEGDKARSNRYFIVESDLEILRAAFEARDLSSLISLPHVHFAWPACGPDLAEQWRHFFDPVAAQKSAFIAHFPCFTINPSFFKAAAETIQSQTFQIFTDINTLVANSEMFLDNFVKNVRKAALSPGIAGFAGHFAKVPAIIVSAGPSLDKNIHELRGFEENALILSTDTALKPLLAAGIDPHFILTGDPSHDNYLHLQSAPTRDAYIVAEASSFPDVFDEFSGKILTCTFENSSLRSLSDLLGNKGSLRAWGSVATVALDFALLLQCDPIVFVGQDLAHTDGRIYCTGIIFDDEWFNDIFNPLDWHLKLEQLRCRRRSVSVEDVFGRPVESTDKLTAYWNWIQRVIRDNPKTRYINATEGGILKDHVEILSLRDALHRECGTNRRLRKRVAEIYADAQNKNLVYSGIDLSLLLQESVAIREALKKGQRLCETDNSCPIPERISRLEAAKESIYLAPHLAPLLDCFNQMGNVAFLRKRNTAMQRAADSKYFPDLLAVYSEYFATVNDALCKIDKALGRIAANLNNC